MDARLHDQPCDRDRRRLLDERGSRSPTDDAQEAYRAGLADYNAGRYEAAATKFETAYRLDPDPGYLFNIAQAHRLSGSCGKAVEYYDRFLKSVSTPIDLEPVKRYRIEAQRCAANPHVAPARRVGLARRWTTWAIPAGISAGVATGFEIDGVSSKRQRDAYLSDSANHTLAEAQAMDQRYRRDALIADIAAVTAGALAITSAVVFVTRPSASIVVTPSISANAAEITLTGRY